MFSPGERGGKCNRPSVSTGDRFGVIDPSGIDLRWSVTSEETTEACAARGHKRLEALHSTRARSEAHVAAPLNLEVRAMSRKRPDMRTRLSFPIAAAATLAPL